MVNADDLGLHPAIDDGILTAHRDGIVTSATVLVCGRSAGDAIEQARAQGLALGVHLSLTSLLTPAAPVHEVASLAPAGTFRASWFELSIALALGRVRLREVDRELRAQVARARSLGMDPDHLDGHEHIHCLPGIAGVVEGIARDEGLALRWPTEAPRARWLGSPGAALKTLSIGALARARRGRGLHRVQGLGVFEAGRLDEARLHGILIALAPGTYELGCHPGKDPGQVVEEPTWRYRWLDELGSLSSPATRAIVEQRGIRLVTYADLARDPGGTKEAAP